MNSLDEKIRELIDNWVYELAEQYEGASDRVKQTLEENPASEETWATLIAQIKQVFQDEQFCWQAFPPHAHLQSGAEWLDRFNNELLGIKSWIESIGHIDGPPFVRESDVKRAAKRASGLKES